MSATWSGARLAAAIARLKDAGMTESHIARLAAVGRATVNRWARGANRPDYDAIRRLAAAVFRNHPAIARELVEASGYPWSEPAELPEPDALADVLGEDAAERLRRELATRGEAGAIVLADMEHVLRPPASGPSGSERPRAAGLPRPMPPPALPCPGHGRRRRSGRSPPGP